MQDTNRGSAFLGRAAALFGSQVFGAGLSVVNGIMLARVLGPAAKGDYYILVLMPATALVLLQLGLPQAFGFFAARGQTASMMTKALALTTASSLAALAGLAMVLPLIRDALSLTIRVEQILLAFLAFPLAVHATFSTAIVMGRLAVRWYAGVNVVRGIATTALLVVIVGGPGLSVNSAVAVYVISSAIQTVGFAIGAGRVRPVDERAQPVSYRELLGYGLPYFPGSLAWFFSYRVDAYLIAFLLTNASEPLGFYTLAVGLAEMVYFFPRAVSTLFFPHVAGSNREQSDSQVGLVSRVTILVTGAVAILMIPAAAVMIGLILPAFGPSLAPLFVLLPGAVALSGASVVSSFLAGIGRPGITSSIALLALGINIVANLILIPRYGIIGASTASLMSYSLTAFLLTAAAARLTRTSIIDFWLPRVSDLRYLFATTAGILRRGVEGLGPTPAEPRA